MIQKVEGDVYLPNIGVKSDVTRTITDMFLVGNASSIDKLIEFYSSAINVDGTKLSNGHVKVPTKKE